MQPVAPMRSGLAAEAIARDMWLLPRCRMGPSSVVGHRIVAIGQAPSGGGIRGLLRQLHQSLANLVGGIRMAEPCAQLQQMPVERDHQRL